MIPIALKYQDFLAPDQISHMTRAQLDTSRPKPLHSHDFYELIWVQNGIVRQLTPQGRNDLREGDIVFVRPGDVHGLQGRSEAALVVSLSIRPDVIEAIGARHTALQGHFFWAGGDRPIKAHRDMRELAALNHAALRLERSALSALELESFLLPLCTSLLDKVSALPADLPSWLARACAAAREPRIFREGSAGLVAQSGMAHPHVSRTMRRLLGQSPSEYVNAIRMDYAARKLTGTDDPLPDIAAEIGLPNLSHFHKLFRVRHGTTPSAFRRRFQKNLLQPRENI